MAIFQNSAAQSAADDAEVVTKSCRFDGGSNLSRTFGSGGNRKTWTLAAWIKLGDLSPTSANGTILARATSSNDDGGPTIWMDGGPRFAHAFDPSGTDNVRMTKAIYRDPAAWYHVVWWCDTEQTGSSGNDRWKIYVNGELQELETPSGYNGEPAVDTTLGVNDAANHTIGTYASQYFDGLLADIYFIDGSAVVPTLGTNFIKEDSTTGQLKPMEYTSSLGTNGFHLDFKDNGDSGGNLGHDASGSNDWEVSNIAAHDQLNDRPTNNYAAWNPLDSHATLTEGNLKWADGNGSGYLAFSTVAIPDIASTQKYYAEFVVDSGYGIGIAPAAKSGSNYATYTSGGVKAYYANTGNKYDDSTSSTYGDSFGTSNVIGVLVGDGKVEFFKDNTSQGDAFTGLTGAYKFAAWAVGSAGAGVLANFGADPTMVGTESGENNSEFFYALPSGAVALSTANLPDPTIAKGSDYFDTILYEADSSTGSRNITGLDFTPSLTWLKTRNAANWHRLVDSERGGGKTLYPNEANVEGEDSESGYISAFISGGFTLTEGSTDFNDVNNNGSSHEYATWNWKQDSTAGFKIATYTGNSASTQTISSLGVGGTPEFVIVKNRDSELISGNTQHWVVYHKSVTSGNVMYLDTSGSIAYTDGGGLLAVGDNSITVGEDSWTYQSLNNDGDNYVAYVWGESVSSFNSFKSFTGASDAFVWLGFRAAFLMCKNTSSGGWYIFDNAREGYNADNDRLFADDTNIEDTTDHIDILSNGFVVRSSSYDFTSGTVLVAAWAEKPFKYASAR